MMAAYTRVPDVPFLNIEPLTVELWGVGVWASGRWLAGLPGRLRAWWTRPVRDPRPLLMPRPPKAADTYGRHDRSVGEQTIPLADLLAQLNFQPQAGRRREPPLFGTDPIDLWTHPELYGPPVPPPELVATAAAGIPDFAQEA